MRDIEKLQKAELHVHLRGAVDVSVFNNLAAKYGRKYAFEQRFTEMQREKLLNVGSVSSFLEAEEIDAEILLDCENYTDFLKTYFFTSAFFRESSDLLMAAESVCDYLISQNVIYAEVTVSIHEYVNLGLRFEEILEVVSLTTNYAGKLGLTLRWIVDLVRDFGPEQCNATLDNLIKHRTESIVGITIGGNEINFPPNLFVDIYKRAKANDFKTSIHSGEGLGAESVEYVLKNIQPDRIGHGIRVLENEKIVKTAIDQGIVFEICPSSNVFLGLYQDIENHPLKNLYDYGAKITINTDDPTFFRSNLNQELFNLKSMGFNFDQVLEFLKNSFEYSFLSDQQLKRKLLSELDLPSDRRR